MFNCLYHDKIIVTVHMMNIQQCRAAVNLQTKPTDLGRYHIHPPLPYSLTQPESRYSFHVTYYVISELFGHYLLLTFCTKLSLCVCLCTV